MVVSGGGLGGLAGLGIGEGEAVKKLCPTLVSSHTATTIAFFAKYVVEGKSRLAS